MVTAIILSSCVFAVTYRVGHRSLFQTTVAAVSTVAGAAVR